MNFIKKKTEKKDLSVDCESNQENTKKLSIKSDLPKDWLKRALIGPSFKAAVILGVCLVLVLGSFSHFINTSLYEPSVPSEIVENAFAQSAISNNESISKDTGKTASFKAGMEDSEYKEITKTIEYETSEMCFIGDSRTVGMQNSVLVNTNWICKSSMGLDWLKKEAEPQLEEIKDDIKLCIILLGVNDLFDQDAYVTELNDLAERYPNIHFVFSTVGPVDESQFEGITNTRIEEFNETVVNGLSDKWTVVDYYRYLAAEGFVSTDGLHYSQAVYGVSFAWIVDQVRTYEYTEKVEVLKDS